MTEGYDLLSTTYDRFVNWNNRLRFEIPFLLAKLNQLGELNKLKVVDAACGTGMHALALAREGIQVTGTDLSAGMIRQSTQNARKAGLDVPFIQAGFGSLLAHFAPRSLDAVFVLGNSLPHLLSRESLINALRDFAAILRPGGILLMQNRNFDAVMRNQDAWMEPQSAAEDRNEWVFVRHYDFRPDGLIDFHVITLARQPESGWRQAVSTTQLRPLLSAELRTALNETGFTGISEYGGLNGSVWDPSASPNLVVSACAA